MSNSPTRFLSLDVFRGMTVCFMIIVNTPGSGATPFAPLLHASWHGFTVTDLVFPGFLFAVGNAMSFTKAKLESDSMAFFKILKRTAWIFLLGYLLYWFPYFKSNEAGELILKPISETRIFGVLQRIALCYFFAALMIHYLNSKKIIILSVFFLLGYWAILLAFGDPADPYSMLGNAGHYLDKFLFGESHLSKGEGVPFEAQGLLSTMPAIVLTIIGYFAGKFIRENGKNYESIAKLLLSAAVLIFIALCWDSVFPINKKLWTGSFILLTSGLNLAIIAALLYVVEIKSMNKWNWTYFFTVFGKNPLFIYLVAEVGSRILGLITLAEDTSLRKAISINVFQAIAPGPIGSLLFALSFMLLCWLVGLWMDKKHIYIKV
ncbi:MAG: heparan-alpha-glucosaminide N-acetyltransferase domain-containing protein [Daejeonella sp.]|uniref:acyltransferase family protein n=1 Tax=Daejeonella sp. TaxID=2805397 RepID=UPI002737780C|nr:heparan-alpha-glucosaminide N-acetyltransferase domain-containing protein [Daejeonella sp.]MDP3468548.1 heparan-alpha-glucosaminide N-acetyltransferase domain-containing protein [Daejeonella sp.]